MDAAGKLLGERFVDHAMALDAAFAGEGRRDDADRKMRLAALAIAGMAAVALRIVGDLELSGREGSR